MLSYCEISATPAFQFLVTELTPTFGDHANREAYRDYMEYNGVLREANEIILKKKKEFFSTTQIPAKPAQNNEGANEIPMTKKAIFAELGTSVPKKQISNQQLINLKTLISKTNNEMVKAGRNVVFAMDPPVQVGQSDNFTWNVRAFKGKLDVEAKADRLTQDDLEKNQIPSFLSQGAQTTLNYQQTQKNFSHEFIRKYADALKQQFGVEYEYITSEQAVEITKDAANPWTGQKSFFFGGKIYFIDQELTPDDILHEFIHPVIRSIAVQNRPLFNSLYNKLLSTPEGQKTVEEVMTLYPNLTMAADDFKEEVLVRSLAKIQDVNAKGLESSPAFQKFINDLLYAIKQLLRQAFGKKIKVSDLDVNTTLKQLSEMFEQGESFEMDIDVITDKDLVSYKNEYEQFMKDINTAGVNQREMEDLTNKFFDAVKKGINDVRKQKNLGDTANIIENDFKTGELQNVVKNLKPYQTVISQDSKQMADEAELTRERVLAVINSLGSLDNMVAKITEGLEEIVKDVDDPDNIQRVQYYQKVLNYWESFAKGAREVMEQNGVKVKLIAGLVDNVEKANRLVNKFYEKASRETLWNVLKTTAENIDKKWETRIDQLKARKAPQLEIDEAIKQAKDEKLTPELIEQALSGNLKDISWLATYLEAAGYSPDPVLGGTSTFVKQKLAEVEIAAQKGFNEAAIILKPLLDKVGYNPNKPGDIGERLGKKEKVGHVNKDTGEFEEREVWRFVNQFTGAELARDRFLYKIKKAKEKYLETHSATDLAALAAIQAEHEQHERDFFNTKYTEDFYKAYDILRSDPAGQQAKVILDDLYDELNLLTGQLYEASSEEVLEISEKIELKRREIRQVSSVYDVVGNMKTGVDLDIAMRIKAFNESVADIYESVEVPQAFQNAYRAYEQKLKDEGKNEYERLRLMDAWKEKNTRVAITDEFWAKMDLINTAIKDILATMPQNDALQLQIDEAYAIIKDLIKGNRDESGQPLGNALSPEKQQKILEAQKKIDAARDALNNMSGLTRAEQAEMQRILAKMSVPGSRLTQKESLTLSRLFDKQATLRLNKIQRAELNSLFAELDELRTREATEDYSDAVNNILSGIDAEKVGEILGTLHIDKNNAYLLGEAGRVEQLMNISPEFEEWFLRNHTSRETVDWETSTPKTVWSRTYAWNVIKPNEDQYYKTTKIKNLAGEEITLKALPSLKFYKRLVKDQYLTPEIEGQTKDNRGYWLPKTMAQGAKDDRYQDKDYARMRQTDPDLFALLEAIKKIHLKNQEGLHPKNKLYMDFPRYRKQFTERMQSEGVLGRIMQRSKDFFSKVKDGWDSGFNAETEMNLVKMDLFDDEMNTVPISGMYDLSIEEISTDVVFSTMRYMLSAERNKQLTKISPVVRMIQKVVNNEKNYPVQSKILNNSTLIFSNKKKSKYLRATAVNNYIERNFEGQVNTGLGSESALAQNFSNFIFKRASSAFLGLNIPSAIKNAVSMKFQGMVEALAGKHMDWKSFVSAEMEASETAFASVAEIYKQGPKSLNIQLMELFDPDRDRFNYHFGESITRTPGKDYSYLILNRFNDFRKITQLQAGLQTLFGMMKYEKITLTTGEKISYKNAWEIGNGKIQTKDTVPAEWGVTYDQNGQQVIGQKFIEKRLEYQRVIDNLNGAMGHEERPEADRYLLFRYISFFRRFLTSMLMNRIAKNRRDYQLQDTKEGFYRTFLKLMWETTRNMGRNLPFMTLEEKAASMRMIGDIGFTMLLKYLVLATILGFDDDDEDRFKKLRANSDVFPGLFVYDDPQRQFKLMGWLENHAVLQTMSVASENSQFVPYPGWGLGQYKDFFNIKSMALGPTINSYFDLINDAYFISTGNEKARYKRTANPYIWGQEGELKVLTHLAKMFGLTGSTIDPALAVRNYQTMQNR